MSRLTERDKYDGGFWVKDKYGEDRWFSPKGKLYTPIEKLAHYEDLEEQGRLIELPCKVAERVWVADGVHKPWQATYIRNHQIVLDMECGWAIGYTKEEAEAKLAELGGKA